VRFVGHVELVVVERVNRALVKSFAQPRRHQHAQCASGSETPESCVGYIGGDLHATRAEGQQRGSTMLENADMTPGVQLPTAQFPVFLALCSQW